MKLRNTNSLALSTVPCFLLFDRNFQIGLREKKNLQVTEAHREYRLRNE